MVINDNILLQLAFIEPWQNDQKVLDPELGWSQFRSEYGSSSWRWIAAATRARYYPIQGFILVYSLPTLFRLILMSGTMSEDSLVRVAGIYNYQKVNIMYKFFFNRCSQRGQEHYSSAVQESLQTEPVPSNPDSWQDWNEVNAISIDQVVLTDSIRWRDRDLGFLLPLAVTGKKIQVGSHYQSHSYVTFIDIIDMHTTSKGVLPAHESNEHCRYLWFGFNLEPELQLYHHQKRGWRSSCASVGMATYLSGSSVDFAPLVTRSRLCWIFDQGTSRCLSMITMSNLLPA